jgi:hypothetical protein
MVERLKSRQRVMGAEEVVGLVAADAKRLLAAVHLVKDKLRQQ